MRGANGTCACRPSRNRREAPLKISNIQAKSSHRGASSRAVDGLLYLGFASDTLSVGKLQPMIGNEYPIAPRSNKETRTVQPSPSSTLAKLFHKLRGVAYERAQAYLLASRKRRSASLKLMTFQIAVKYYAFRYPARQLPHCLKHDGRLLTSALTLWYWR